MVLMMVFRDFLKQLKMYDRYENDLRNISNGCLRKLGTHGNYKCRYITATVCHLTELFLKANFL